MKLTSWKLEPVDEDRLQWGPFMSGSWPVSKEFKSFLASLLWRPRSQEYGIGHWWRLRVCKFPLNAPITYRSGNSGIRVLVVLLYITSVIVDRIRLNFPSLNQNISIRPEMSSKTKDPSIPTSLADVPPAEAQSWPAYLKSLANFRGNIGSLSAPSFIISGTSLTEYSAYWVSSPILSSTLIDYRLNILNCLHKYKRQRLPNKELWKSLNGSSGHYVANIHPVMRRAYILSNKHI